MTETQSKIKQLNQAVSTVLGELEAIINHNEGKDEDTYNAARKIVLEGITMALNLIEIKVPGSALLLYADVETVAKQGRARAIKSLHPAAISVETIQPWDNISAVNYLEDEFYATFIKVLAELPLPLRTLEIMLQGVAFLLSNILLQKFPYPHQMLDTFCHYVHGVLGEFDTTARH